MKRQLYKKMGAWFLCFVLLTGYFSTVVYAAGNIGQGNNEEQKEIPDKTVSENLAEEKRADISEDGGKTMEKAVSANNLEKTQKTLEESDVKALSAEQYHFVEEDLSTIEKWMEIYCPDGYEELLSYDEEWWESLYGYERAYAEFLIGLAADLSEDIYDGQDLPECIRILESGVDAGEFFKGTVFQGITLQDLKEFSEAGLSMEELENIISDMASYILTDGDLVSKVTVSPTGYMGTGHGMIYKINLGGQPAMCFAHGKSCRSAFLYNANSGTYKKKHGPLGYFVNHASVSGVDYVACQIAAWLFLVSEDFTRTNVRTRALAMLNKRIESSATEMLNKVCDYYANAKSNPSDYYLFYSDNHNAQPLGVPRMPKTVVYQGSVPPLPPTPVDPLEDTISREVSASYAIQIYKRDWQTGVGLLGCEVEIFEDGEYLTTVTTDDSGHAEYSVTKTETVSASYDGVTVIKEQAEAELEKKADEFMAKEYTFSTSEITAPTGYVWEPNDKEQTITGNGTAEFELTNERTLGAVELIKYDTESECGTAQGDAVLDGAEYGIYAAEDIVHQDGKTGVVFQKDALVQTAVVGRTPKRNHEGYILNTDGSRHIANPGGTIAYDATPGRTLFGDLELGAYYIKEIKPSEGYMLDEAVYKATFTYKWQMTKIEIRDEEAKSAQNELTADDSSTSKAVYSGDYAIKQGIRFVKTSDNTFQTELKPIEGAGFKIYLISNLSGVKNGSVKPLGDKWTADDIMTFYDYDFSREKPATLYKRTGHEAWTEGDRLWLEAGERPNEYYVKEMFTDVDGQVITPELPYGTYVVVETTTPEHHVCAKPFIVYITRDGGVLYSDETKQTVEKAYTEEEGIRYGDHEGTKSREGRVLQKQRIINNTITKTFLRVMKADEEFTVIPGTYIEAEEFVRGTVLKEGAEYRIRCLTMELSRESLLSLNWKYDKDGFLSYFDPNAKIMTGTSERPFRTSFLRKDGVIKDCYITLPQEIPIGTYEVTEVTAPEGYVVNGCEQEISDISEGRINGYEVIDAPSPKAVFTINNGAVYPDGQMGMNKYALQDEYGNLTVTILQENQEQKGVIEITKHGEQFSGAHEDTITLLDKLEQKPFRSIMKSAEAEHKDLVFEYEDAPVEGASFDIIAAEDIYTQELQKDLLEQCAVLPEDYLIHHEGDIVATIETDRNGWGYAAGLYIGKYIIKETVAGNGFVLNTTETEFEITPKEQSISFDFHTADYKNERQKLEIDVEKQDGESGEMLAGAVYGLYAEEDICTNIVLDADTGKWVVREIPETLYSADTLLATCITDKDGKGVFDEDLPLSKYYVRELEGPVGYLTASEDISVDGSYGSPKGGQNIEKQRHQVVFINKKTQAVIAKQDLATGKAIPGALLEIKEIETDEGGNLKKDGAGEYITETIASWVSQGSGEEMHYFYEDNQGYLMEIAGEDELPDGKELIKKEGHFIKGLQLDRVYMLSERMAPYGYGYAKEILLKLLQEKAEDGLSDVTGLYLLDGENWNRVPEDVLVMQDEKQGLDIEKSTIRMTQPGDNYKYTVDELKNLTDGRLDNVTVTDKLPPEIYLTELWTGTYNESLLYDVEYKTNQSDEWIVWGSGLDTNKNYHLAIPEELLTKEKHVSQFRICFGTVGGGFSKVEPPVYFTTVLPGASNVILNEIEMQAELNGRVLRDKDETETVLYQKKLAGYRARGGAFPLYEIVETNNEIPKEKIVFLKQIIEQADWREENPDAPQKISAPNPATVVPQTGDNTFITVWVVLCAISVAGIAIWSVRRRKRGIE